MTKEATYQQKEAVVYSLESIMDSGIGQSIYFDKISPILVMGLKSKTPNLRFVTLKVLAKLIKDFGSSQALTPEIKLYSFPFSAYGFEALWGRDSLVGQLAMDQDSDVKYFAGQILKA